MKLFNATKKIAAVGAASVIVANAAFAAGLNNYPNNFVEDGKFVGNVVVGSSATADAAAAEALIADLTADLGGDEKVKITYRKSSSGGDSVEVADSGKALNFGERLNLVKSSAFDNDDSDVLADESLKLKSTEDYSQEIEILGGKFEHALRDDLEDEISSHIYFAKENVLSYALAFDSTVDLTGYKEKDIVGKTLTIMGNKFTVGNDYKITGTGGLEKIKLLGGSNEVSLGEGDSQSVTIDGKSYDVSVQSVSDDKVLLTLNGQSKSIDLYDSEEVAGVNVVVTEVQASSRDSVAGYAQIVIGGNELVLEHGKEVKINDEKISDLFEDYKVTANFANNGGWDGLSLVYSWDNSDGFMLTEDKPFEDKVFQAFSLDFEGLNNVEYSKLKIESAGEKLKISGTTADGEDFSEEVAQVLDKESETTPVSLIGADEKVPFLVGDITDFSTVKVANTSVATAVAVAAIGDDKVYRLMDDTKVLYVGTGKNIKALVSMTTTTVNGFKSEAFADGTRFLVGDADNQFVYEATSYDDEQGKETFDFEDVLSDVSKTDIKADDADSKLKEVETFTYDDSVDYVSTITSENGVVGLAFENEVLVDLSGVSKANVADSSITVKFDSGDMDSDDDVDIAPLTVDFGAYDDSDNEFSLSLANTNIVDLKDGAEADLSESNDDTQEFVTKYGTKIIVDAEDKESIEFMVPNKQVEASVVLNFGGSKATVESTFVSADEVEAKKAALEEEGYKIVGTEAAEAVEVEVTAPMTDAEVTEMSNLIVVGGPAVNAIARTLLGVEEYSMEAAGVVAGEAVAKYFADSNSVLVYGYEAADTAAIVEELVAGEADFE